MSGDQLAAILAGRQLPTPVAPRLANTAILEPALHYLPPKMDSIRARVMLLAIGMQESRFTHRRQLEDGPARGFWQFERGGGVTGVLNHPASRPWMQTLCAVRNVAPNARMVWAQLAEDDIFAAGVARLLLWTDVPPLPEANDPDEGWDCYIRTWRPGKPHPATWASCHAMARTAVGPPGPHRRGPVLRR